jgi:hypothetical protein
MERISKTMSRNVGSVEFDDGTVLYFVYNGTVDVASRSLFNTQEEAWESHVNKVVSVKPTNPKATEEDVNLCIDIHFKDNHNYSFPSKASKIDMWITGPRSYGEVQYK